MKIIAQNRKASFEYHLDKKFEAGIALRGTEVKALRAGKVNFGDAWVDIENGSAILRDCHIGHYTHGNIMNHEEMRPRQLLLKKKEIVQLEEAAAARGFTLIPTKIYFRDSLVKLEIATAKGKKLFDKRAATKERDDQRAIARAIKR